MKRIRIEYFKNLDNYGTAMMGLVTVAALARRYGPEQVEFHCDFDDDRVLEEARAELPAGIRLVRRPTPDQRTAGLSPLRRKTARLGSLLFENEGKGFDMLVVLGGDDLSEYYSPWAPALALLRKWRASSRTRVVLLGQTVGPFARPLNRLLARRLMPRMELYSRDEPNAAYLAAEFGLHPRLSADLALCDLPLQKETGAAPLSEYGLHEAEYVTVIVSGCQSGGRYYCRNTGTYIARFREIVRGLLADPRLTGKRIVLLAHTFGSHGDEPAAVRAVAEGLDPAERERIVPVAEKIGPTRARAILGHGLFTVTGRMHAAVSTFQGGRPAISLSYSAKYDGVIGRGLGRGDLIVEADDDRLWESGRIAELVAEKTDYLLTHYGRLCGEIAERVAATRRTAEETLKNL